MATIRKVGVRWRAEVRRSGVYRSATFATRREARDWAAAAEVRIDQPAAGGETVRGALVRYAREVSPTKKGRRWEEIRLAALGADVLGDVPLGRLSARDLAEWRDRRLLSVSAATVNRELNLLSAVFERARREWRLLEHNPARDVSRPRNPRPRDRRISADEIERVLLALGFDEGSRLETAQHDIAVAFLLALETAMRLGELMSLDWASVRLERRHVVLRDSKNTDRRAVPLSLRAVALFRLLGPRRDGPVFRCSTGTASTLFRRAVRRVRIADLRFHDARHEALTRLARKLDVLDLARMVGHRDPRSLMVYYNATAEEIAGRLDGSGSG